MNNKQQGNVNNLGLGHFFSNLPYRAQQRQPQRESY